MNISLQTECVDTMVMSLAANVKKDNPPLLPVTVDLTTYKTNTPAQVGRKRKS